MFRSQHDRATAYAAYKTLERLLQEDGELPPDTKEDVSGNEITIKLPTGTVVYREAGSNGDGSMYKKATQNLYGFATWAAMIERLRCFHQWNKIRDAIIDALKSALQRPATRTVETQLVKIDPDLAQAIEALKRDFPIPDRREQTPRICKETEAKATVTIKRK